MQLEHERELGKLELKPAGVRSDRSVLDQTIGFDASKSIRLVRLKAIIFTC